MNHRDYMAFVKLAAQAAGIDVNEPTGVDSVGDATFWDPGYDSEECMLLAHRLGISIVNKRHFHETVTLIEYEINGRKRTIDPFDAIGKSFDPAHHPLAGIRLGVVRAAADIADPCGDA